MNENILHNNNELDSFLKEKYKNHVIPPDPELWEGINMRLYQNKINRNMRQMQRLKISSLSLGVAVISMLVYFELKINSFKEEETVTFQNELPQQVISGENHIPLPSATSSDTNIIKQKLSGEGLNKTNLIIEQINFQNKNPEQKNKPVLSLTEQTDSNQKSIPFELKIIASQWENKIENQATENVNTIQLTVNPETEVTNNNTIEPIIQSNVEPNGQLPKNHEIDNLQFDKSENDQENHEQKRYFIEGFFSPEISYRTLLVNPDIEQPTYNKAYFNTRDKASFTFSTGVKAGYLINGKWAVKTGIFFSQYAQRFKTEAVNVLYNNGNGYIYTSTGLSNLSISSSDSIAPETFFNSSLRFNYLNFPLMVEYKISRNYIISFGLNFNYLMWQELNWQAENYDGVSEYNYDKIDGIKTGSISLLIGVSYERAITQNIKLVINPSLKAHLTSLSNTSPVKAFPYSWGLQTGFRYYF